MLGADQFKYLVFAVATLVIVGGSIALVPSQRRKIRKKLTGRAPLTDDEFRSLFASADAELALTIRNQLTGYLLFPVELVHADDKLCADVGLGVRDGLDVNSFVRDVERAIGTTIPVIEAQKLYTIRDIVAFASSQRIANWPAVSPGSGRS